MVDATLVARAALDRWALVDLLGLTPDRGLDLDAGFARLAHPSSTTTDVVLLVRGEVELQWLRRVGSAVRGSRRPVVVALVAAGDGRDDADEGATDRDLRAAGAAAVVRWHGSGAADRGSLERSVAAALERGRPTVLASAGRGSEPA